MSSYLERHARVLELAQWKVISTTGSSGTAKWQQILFAEWRGVSAEQRHRCSEPLPWPGGRIGTTIYIGMPATLCANENGTCTFTDTATIAYGSLATGRFTARKDKTSPVACSNAYSAIQQVALLRRVTSLVIKLHHSLTPFCLCFTLLGVNGNKTQTKIRLYCS